MTILASTDATTQQRAYTVLGELLALPLAAATWTIRRNGDLSAEIDGRLPDYFGHDWAAEILRYAQTLDLGVRKGRLPGFPTSTKFEAHGTWHDVHISVWTPMTADDRKAWGR